MNRCLGIAFHNEREWLSLHLPHLISKHDYDLVMLDTRSTDGSYDVAKGYAVALGSYSPHDDWADQGNALLDFASWNGYKYMVRLDPDELMFTADIVELFNQLETTEVDAISIARFNFENDRHHFSEKHYPDFQTRAFRINNVHYINKVHEHLVRKSEAYREDINIYHYEGLKAVQYRTLKTLNVNRISMGQSPLEVLPREYAALDMHRRVNVEFHGPQPATFKNIYAPYEED